MEGIEAGFLTIKVGSLLVSPLASPPLASAVWEWLCFSWVPLHPNSHCPHQNITVDLYNCDTVVFRASACLKSEEVWQLLASLSIPNFITLLAVFCHWLSFLPLSPFFWLLSVDFKGRECSINALLLYLNRIHGCYQSSPVLILAIVLFVDLQKRLVTKCLHLPTCPCIHPANRLVFEGLPCAWMETQRGTIHAGVNQCSLEFSGGQEIADILLLLLLRIRNVPFLSP